MRMIIWSCSNMLHDSSSFSVDLSSYTLDFSSYTIMSSDSGRYAEWHESSILRFVGRRDSDEFESNDSESSAQTIWELQVMVRKWLLKRWGRYGNRITWAVCENCQNQVRCYRASGMRSAQGMGARNDQLLIVGTRGHMRAYWYIGCCC